MRQQPRGTRESVGGGKATAVDLMEPQGNDHHMLPVWFFVGIILLTYGILILATGIGEFSRPPSTVLANLHPAIWWGALLVVYGADHDEQRAPPDGRVQVRKHGRGRAGEFSDSRSQNQDAVGQQYDADEKPDGKHVMVVPLGLHQVHGSRFTASYALSCSSRLLSHLGLPRRGGLLSPPYLAIAACCR